MADIIFGPITSRRFGQSLGIDLSPDKKQCNFDCLYCELKGAKSVQASHHFPSVETIIEALKKALTTYQKIDVITLTANGEPTLYPDLKRLVKEINAIKGSHQLLILSNSSTIGEERVQESLLDVDIVKLSLDCATPSCFKKLDRPHKSISLEKIIEGMKRFKTLYKGQLVIEILVVEGINDTQAAFEALKTVLFEINPHRIDIGTIDRPPEYAVRGVSVQRLMELASVLEGLHVNIAYHKHYTGLKHAFDASHILEMLKRRPLSEDDVMHGFDETSKHLLEKLFLEKKIFLKKVAGIRFYTCKESSQV